MARWWVTIAMMGCGVPHELLGGQEGEPIAPPAEVPAPNDDDFAADPQPPPDQDGDGIVDCLDVVHCEGEGWCAEYGAQTAPDLEATCKGSWGEGPCDRAGIVSTCALGVDPCTQVFVYDGELVCEELAAVE